MIQKTIKDRLRISKKQVSECSFTCPQCEKQKSYFWVSRNLKACTKLCLGGLILGEMLNSTVRLYDYDY